jgi:hypothetical protein
MPKRKQKSDAPKRPLSAYNFYFREQRELLIAEEERLPPEEQSKGRELFAKLGQIIASRWKNITPEQLEPYQAKAAEDAKRYGVDMRDYHAREAERAMMQPIRNQFQAAGSERNMPAVNIESDSQDDSMDGKPVALLASGPPLNEPNMLHTGQSSAILSVILAQSNGSPCIDQVMIAEYLGQQQQQNQLAELLNQLRDSTGQSRLLNSSTSNASPQRMAGRQQQAALQQLAEQSGYGAVSAGQLDTQSLVNQLVQYQLLQQQQALDYERVLQQQLDARLQQQQAQVSNHRATAAADSSALMSDAASRSSTSSSLEELQLLQLLMARNNEGTVPQEIIELARQLRQQE